MLNRIKEFLTRNACDGIITNQTQKYVSLKKYRHVGPIHMSTGLIGKFCKSCKHITQISR